LGSLQRRFVYEIAEQVLEGYFFRLIMGAGIGRIGIFFIIFGTMYFLATTILEYMKEEDMPTEVKYEFQAR
jgi:hypothetical protein